MKSFCRGRGFGQTICLHSVVSHAPKFLSLSLTISAGLTPYYTHTRKRNPSKKKISIQSAETVSNTGTVSINSQQDGASTRVTLQSHKTKGNQDAIQMFSEIDSLHEMGVKAVF
jgi:hypothetical protein